MKNIRLAAGKILVMALASAGLMFGHLAQAFGGAAGVEITEVKNVGVSAADEDKSVVQVKWTVAPGAAIKSFDVALEVTYADGATERVKTSAKGSASSARVEVPTLHFSPGRPGAALRSFKASVTASYTETTTRQGNF